MATYFRLTSVLVTGPPRTRSGPDADPLRITLPGRPRGGPGAAEGGSGAGPWRGLGNLGALDQPQRPQPVRTSKSKELPPP